LKGHLVLLDLQAREVRKTCKDRLDFLVSRAYLAWLAELAKAASLETADLQVLWAHKVRSDLWVLLVCVVLQGMSDPQARLE